MTALYHSKRRNKRRARQACIMSDNPLESSTEVSCRSLAIITSKARGGRIGFCGELSSFISLIVKCRASAATSRFLWDSFQERAHAESGLPRGGRNQKLDV
ncbi:hypothetical protein IY145_24040 [Methylosinus sp. H3A]|uniref:hypothetical protein n=1 Tax=Methylosinus sp. H3A TaxID=2785786 RepID=UPI0018C2A52C|nr:hypothetical protein [Methylosinus sp. H3A]MBG0812411.1 hypothetical protein [Methylosinus sp. H3A]